MKSSLFKISFSDLYRIEQTIPIRRDLHHHPVQPSDHFRAGQKLVQVIKGIVQMPPKHWQAWEVCSSLGTSSLQSASKTFPFSMGR